MSSVVSLPRIGNSLYPERRDARLSWLDALGNSLAQSLPRAGMRGFSRLRHLIRRHGDHYRALDDTQLDKVIHDLRFELRRRGLQTALIAQSFALIQEIAGRTLGLYHHDVQLQGGWILMQGMIAEMQTGEGKTLTATLAAGTAALAGVPTHVLSVNDYLTQRDADNMSPIYQRLGLSVATVTAGLSLTQRQQAYACDITYCTNKELVFDYLKDRITLGNQTGELRLQMEKLYGDNNRVQRLLLRGLRFAIIDEVDSVLIDEARTPLIISGPSQNTDEPAMIHQALEISAMLVESEHFLRDGTARHIQLTEAGKQQLADLADSLGGLWLASIRREELIIQALTARLLFHRDEHYLVDDGKVVIIDEYTGRSMPDRTWSRGLHQMIEAKEDCELSVQRDPLARISYQRFFRRYLHLSGMTGTGREVRRELAAVYNLRVVRIPTHKPVRRKVAKDRIVTTVKDKWQAVLREVQDLHTQGRPVLIGTRTLAASEQLSDVLQQAGLEHRILNARQDAEEADIIARAGEAGRITIATNMAGRGTDIHLSEMVNHRGGMHVILTERHDAARIDRQLIGRCARQGNQGSCSAWLSREDPLFAQGRDSRTTHHPAQAWLFATPIGQWWSRRLAVRAQRRVERAHFKIRKELLHMDEQLGDQLSFSGHLE